MNRLETIKKRVILCILCIIVLIIILLSYFLTYRIKTKGDEYIDAKEADRIFTAVCEMNDLTDELNKQKSNNTFLTDRYLKFYDYQQMNQILNVGETLDFSKQYKKGDYLLKSDWSKYLDLLLASYGKSEVKKESLEILAFSNQIKNENGELTNKDTLLTQTGIYEYNNIDEVSTGFYNAITYHNNILSIIDKMSNEVNLTNAYIINEETDKINFFYNHYQITMSKEKDYQVKDTVADITICDSSVVDVHKKEDKFNGKLIHISDSEAEIEDFGVFNLSKDMKVYKLYGSFQSLETKELKVGYSFTDFIVEDGVICASLVMKDEDMDVIRVLIKNSDYQSKIHESIDFTCDTDFSIEYYKDGKKDRTVKKKKDEIFHVEKNEFQQHENRIKIIPSALSGNISLLNVNRTQEIPVYRGFFEIEKTDDGLLLVNEVLLEEYLYRVVPSEMPSSYSMEALKAQAVCARTYAYGKMLHAGLAEYGAHVDDSAGFQVYNNISSQPETTEAVKDTLGEILQYQDEPIGAYYYSTSCGVSTDTSVWKSENEEKPPYLKARVISSNEDSIIADELKDEDKFRDFIESVDESNYENEEGYYRWTYEVNDIDSDYMLKQLKDRYENNKNLILTRNKSGEYESKKITKLGKIKDISVIKRNPGGVIDELVIIGSKAVIKVTSELNVRYILCDGETKVVKQNNEEGSMNTLLPSAFFVIDTSKENGYVIGYKLIGGGFGHGVGMSQNAAREMGNLGMNYKDILSYFYENSEIKTIRTKGDS